MREPPEAPLRQEIRASDRGRVSMIDNRRLARVAKLAGAPRDPAAGLRLHVRLGDCIDAGQPVMTIHAEARGQLRYAADYVERGAPIFRIEGGDRP
jgi:thymidine phosphorylase